MLNENVLMGLKVEAQEELKDILNPLSLAGIREIIERKGLKGNLPNAFGIDPRSRKISVFNPCRLNRPKQGGGNRDCPICLGKTTPVFLHEELPKDEEDFSDYKEYVFVNLNLFPFYSPFGIQNIDDADDVMIGAHFLLWPTTAHQDIHQLTPKQHSVSYDLLGRLERCLRSDREGIGLHMQVIKNTGVLAGNSLEHGHYQVGFCNKKPLRILEDEAFARDQKQTYTQYLKKRLTKDLILKEYDSVIVATPPHLRRGLEAVIIPREDVDFIMDLTAAQKRDFAAATTHIARRLAQVMPERGKDFAYNFVFHNGAGMYIEVMPATQFEGGMEKAGLDICACDPETSTNIYNGKH